MPTLSINGRSIHYRDAGAGPSVILLHCSSSHSGQWRGLIGAVEDRFRVLAPDFHGYGRSDPLPRDDRACFDHDLAIVEALMALAGGPAHVVGHSLGGAIAARAAVRRPERVARLALIEPVLFGLIEEADDPRRLEYLDVAHAMLVCERFGAAEKAARLFTDFWTGPGALDALDPDTRAYVVRTIGRVSDDWWGASSRAPGALKAADVASIRAETLILCAENTKPAARAVVEALRAALPSASYDEIPGAGHMAPVTHPEPVNARLAAFLDAS